MESSIEKKISSAISGFDRLSELEGELKSGGIILKVPEFLIFSDDGHTYKITNRGEGIFQIERDKQRSPERVALDVQDVLGRSQILLGSQTEVKAYLGNRRLGWGRRNEEESVESYVERKKLMDKEVKEIGVDFFVDTTKGSLYYFTISRYPYLFESTNGDKSRAMISPLSPGTTEHLRCVLQFIYKDRWKVDRCDVESLPSGLYSVTTDFDHTIGTYQEVDNFTKNILNIIGAYNHNPKCLSFITPLEEIQFLKEPPTFQILATDSQKLNFSYERNGHEEGPIYNVTNMSIETNRDNLTRVAKFLDGLFK